MSGKHVDSNSDREVRYRLEESEELLKAIHDSVLDGIVTIDTTGRIRSVNPAMERIFGYRPEELLGRNIRIIMSEPHCSRHDEYISRYIETDEKKVIGIGRETIGKKRDGTLIPIDLTVTEMSLSTGRLFVGILRDISERKNAEQKLEHMLLKLERQNEELESLLNRIRMGVCITDHHGRITFLSRFCQDTFGIVVEKTDTVIWDQMWSFTDAVKEQVWKKIHDPAVDDSSITLEIKSLEEGMKWLDLEVLVDPRNPQGRLLLFDDVTELHHLRSQMSEKKGFGDIIGHSAAMQTVFRQIEELARYNIPVLITGETGVGKELVSKALHSLSPRKDKPFIPVNMAGYSESLIASQFFGHVRGAFTGAISDHKGVFETANKGTVFLDEIGDIPFAQQASLLRTLQEQEIVRLGESIPRKVDVRIITATNRDLDWEVEHGRFRSDLMYRLKVGTIHVPPLRDRKEDIPILAHYFIRAFAASIGSPVQSISDAAVQKLLRYHWPGNVRELKNVLDSAVIFCNEKMVTPEHIQIGKPKMSIDDSGKQEEYGQPGRLKPRESGGKIIFGTKKDRLIEALIDADGNRTEAARKLGIGRTTLYRRIKKYGIEIRE